MQSREGMPLGKARCWANQGARCLAQRWMAVGPSPPQRMPQTAMTTTSTRRCLRLHSVPRVGERFEVGAEGADVDELGHGSHPGFSPCGPWRRTEAVSDPGTRKGTRISTRGPSPDHPDRSAIRAGRGPIGHPPDGQPVVGLSGDLGPHRLLGAAVVPRPRPDRLLGPPGPGRPRLPPDPARRTTRTCPSSRGSAGRTPGASPDLRADHRAGDRGDGGDPVGQLGGQAVAHHAAVGEAGGVDPLGIDVGDGGQVVEDGGDVAHVVGVVPGPAARRSSGAKAPGPCRWGRRRGSPHGRPSRLSPLMAAMIGPLVANGWRARTTGVGFSGS